MSKLCALIIVDMQNDFCPGGALEVKDGDKVVPIINSVQEKVDLVVATQDWHPLNHSSFTINDPNGPWPVHCVKNTYGAKLVTGLHRDRIARIFRKGTDVASDSYSGFFDNDHKKSTGLGGYLHNKDISEVHIVGLATDYCVMYTAFDAKSSGFETTLIQDATRGVNVHPDDVKKAIEEMRKHGIKIMNSWDL